MINQLHMKSRITTALNFFVAGGTIHRHAPCYVKRPADDELLRLVLAGQFCYVLTSRQMGKSSLMVRTVQRLKAKQIKSVIIDLTAIGRATVDQWYLALLARIARKLRLSVSPEVWWQEQASLSIVERFTQYLLHVALAECSGQLVIFIDEINSTTRFDFTGDLFAAIRAMYDARTHNSAFERLSFVLIGTASASELIKDGTPTPFNIGYPIALPEFSRDEASVLQSGLELEIYRHVFNRDWLSEKRIFIRTTHQAQAQAEPLTNADK